MSDDHDGGRGSEPTDSATQQLPTLDQLRGDVAPTNRDHRRAERQWNRRFAVVSMSSQRSYAHLRGLQDHYRHKSAWSTFLMWTMGSLLGFQSVLLALVGFGWWKFTDYDWLLPALMVQNLAAVIGLAVVVVKALFKDVDQPEFETDSAGDDTQG